MPGELLDRDAPGEAEQSQVEHRDRAEQQADADNMHDLDRGIEPQPMPHRLPEAARLERAQRAAGRRTHLSSMVLPLIVMRSARISSGLLRLA
jgi:hypothetical protein